MALSAPITPNIPPGAMIGHGVVVVNASSPLYCLNRASHTQTNGFANVTTVLAGVHASHAFIRPFQPIPGAQVLALFHAWKEEITNPPVIRIYSQMPKTQAPKDSEDEIMEFLGNNNTDEYGREFWVPLADRSGNTSITLGTTSPAMTTTNTGKGDQNISAPVLIDILGRNKFLVVVETPIDNTGSSSGIVAPTGIIGAALIW